MNFKIIFLSVILILTVCFVQAQNDYFVQVPQKQIFFAYDRFLKNLGFEFFGNKGSIYGYSKTERGWNVEITLISPPTGEITQVMYEYSEEGVKLARVYKKLSQAMIELYGKPFIKTTKEMGWFYPEYSITLMRDKDGVAVLWVKEDKK